MPTNKDYAKIHIALTKLGLDDQVYRDILHWKFNVKSAKELNRRQVTVLLNYFKAKGWQPKKAKSKATVKDGKGTKKVNDNFRHIKPGPAAKQQRYILAMWAALGYEVTKLDARCKRQFGIERIEWVTEHEQLHILITDLQKRCRDAGVAPR